MPLGTCVKLNEEGTETPPPSASDLLRRVPEEFDFPMASRESTPSHGLRKFLLVALLVPRGRRLCVQSSSPLFFAQKTRPTPRASPFSGAD